VEQNPGPQKKQHLTGQVWLDLSTRHLFTGRTIKTSLTPGPLWSNPVAVAADDLLQLWTEAQGAAGGAVGAGGSA